MATTCGKKLLYKLSQEKTLKSSLPHPFVNALNMSVGMEITSTFPSTQNSFFVPAITTKSFVCKPHKARSPTLSALAGHYVAI